MKSKQMAVLLAMIPLAGISGWAQTPAPKAGMKRAPQALIDQHADRQWLKANLLDLVSHVDEHAVAPNGFVQLNMDRHWKPYGVQREASVESQGRQVYAMAIAYDNSHDKKILDAMTKAADFLMKMHDDQYGGYYTRVTHDLKVLDDTKSNLQEFAIFAFANAYRVTKDAKYEKAAMDMYHIFMDKMRTGESFSGSMKRDFSGPQTSPYNGDMHHIDVPDYGPEAPAAGRGGAGRAGAGRGLSMNNDIFECFLDLYEATHSQEVWAEINRQLGVFAKMYDYKLGYMPSTVDANGKAVPFPGFENLPAGVNEGARIFQWASVFIRAVQLGADPKFAEMGSRAVDIGLKTAYNKDIGGLGGVDAKGRLVNTFWWSQCEFLKTLGEYAMLDGRSDLWPYYDEALAFIKNNFVDSEYGGWYDEMVPGWSRAKLAEWSVRAYVKGAKDANEFEAFHQSSMFKNLLADSQPQ
jgi:mannose/cellobiose epimerase-like protein (N-acyl-D-glucosamine 2-epimerase family)